jgi:hypothetical protein
MNSVAAHAYVIRSYCILCLALKVFYKMLDSTKSARGCQAKIRSHEVTTLIKKKI